MEISQRIFFAFGKTRILPRSFELLDEVTRALQDRPAVCVSVQGHADSVGNAAANRKLSRGRAAEVVAYLVEHGVDARRLARVEFVRVPCP